MLHLVQPKHRCRALAIHSNQKLHCGLEAFDVFDKANFMLSQKTAMRECLEVDTNLEYNATCMATST